MAEAIRFRFLPLVGGVVVREADSSAALRNDKQKAPRNDKQKKLWDVSCIALSGIALWGAPDLVLAFVGCWRVGYGDALPVCSAYVGSYDRVCGDCVGGLNVAPG